MTPVPTLVFVRHGETDWNVEGRLQGQRDIPLNDRGRGQAKRNGETIRDRIPDAAKFDFISSPLSRTRETMEILRGAMGLDPKGYEVDARLLEITFGELEGFTYRDIEAREPGWSRARHADKWNYLPPGGESYHMLSVRIIGWVETLERPAVVVAHGGVGRVLRAHLLGLDKLATVSEDFPQDRVFLWRDGTGEWL
ncbi:MAG TPA: histidine phosphatase family protein [Bauldia sp.]|nr:histidine phosphatase family protein [Bauldia sp.]